METILCAAIHYQDNERYELQPNNIKTGFVLSGWRHPHIMNTARQLLELRSTSNATQGFLTSQNRFVDRQEAAKIAIEAGQIEATEFQNDTLFSEDLY